MNTPDDKRLVLLNWGDKPKTFSVSLDRPATIINYWNDKNLEKFKDIFIKKLPAHSGAVYKVNDEFISL